MDLWIIIAIASVCLLLVWLGLGLRKNAAGIQTRMSGRAGRMGGFVLRGVFRKLLYKIKHLFAARKRRQALADAYKLKSAEDAAALMGNMKGVFMKLGQIMSFANHALPEQAQQAMRSLQNQAPPMAFSLVKSTIEEELGQSLETLFEWVDELPLAAASIGQVHRARLKDGTEVVIKVQYPGVGQAIMSDLKMASGMISMVKAIYPNADAKSVVSELAQRLREELDYRIELANQQVFYDLWHGHPLIRIPKPYPEYSSTRVLCQEYKKGMSFYEFLESATDAEKRRAILVLNDFVFDSMHRYRVFNGDPHPGNYIFHDDGGISFLDFGCTKYFSASFILGVQSLNRAIVENDRQSFEQWIRELGIVLPGRPYDGDFLWTFFEYHSAPFAKDRVFAFTPEYIAEAGKVMNLGDLRKLNLPPDLLFFNRITFGLNAIFQQLGAAENFHKLYRRYTYSTEPAPPAVALIGVDLPQRFLDNDSQPVAQPEAFRLLEATTT